MEDVRWVLFRDLHSALGGCDWRHVYTDWQSCSLVITGRHCTSVRHEQVSHGTATHAGGSRGMGRVIGCVCNCVSMVCLSVQIYYNVTHTSNINLRNTVLPKLLELSPPSTELLLCCVVCVKLFCIERVVS